MNYLTIICLAVLTACGADSGRFGNSIRGKNINEVLNSMGTPDAQVEFILIMDNIYEYRSDVMHYATAQEKASKVKVKEYSWKGPLGKQYVWFIKRRGQWTAVDGLVWNRGVQY